MSAATGTLRRWPTGGRRSYGRGLCALAALVLCLPQVALAGPGEPGPRPLGIPWGFATDLEGVEAAALHAAGLAFMPRFEFALVGTTRLSEAGPPSSFGGLIGGRLGSLAAALGVAGVGASPGQSGLASRVDLGLAWRFGDVASIGAQWQFLNHRDDAAIDRYWSWGLSTTLRPFRALSAFLSVGGINTPEGPAAFGGAARDEAVIRLGVGLRPFGERGTIGLEGARTASEAGFWQAGLSTRWWLVPGVMLGAWGRLTVPDRGLGGHLAEAGLFLGLSQGGWGLESSVDLADPGGAGAVSTSFMLRSRAERLPSVASPDRIVLRLPIDGSLPERPRSGLFSDGPGFAHWLIALDAASRDPDVAGVLVQIGKAPGWAQCWELREALARLQARGKKVFASLVIADMRAMYLASQADEVWLFASGGMTLTGLAVTGQYYLQALDKLGVRAEFIAFEEYKSFPELATRTGPSEPAREQTRRVLTLTQGLWDAAVGAGRKLDKPAIDAILTDGPQSMRDAERLGLVDALVEADAYQDLLRERLGPVQVVGSYRPWPKGFKRWGGRRHVAIVPVVGSIVDGASAGALPIPLPFIGGASTGDRSFIEALETAVNDPASVGVVVRVDSGGGSVTASDRMHRAILSLSKRKPIVVSFGGAAASGGYYLAAGASTILASPHTVTGSIGIFTGKADLSDLFASLGVTHHTEKTAPRADMLASQRGFTDDERARARQVLEVYYQRFLGIVSEGRGLTPERTAELARGRVWLGVDAIDHGLVDRAGGLLDAIEEVRERAGLDDAPISVRYYGSLGSLSNFQRLVAGVFELPELGSETPAHPELASLGEAFIALTSLESGGALALMPFSLRID